MINKDFAHDDCNYRFKGKSCEDCKLDCIYKNKNDLYRKYKAQEQQINNLATKLEKIRNLVSRYRSCYAKSILKIIEGAEK